MEHLYKPSEVAPMLGVTYETVLEWIGSGALPAYTNPSGHYRIYENDVNAALLPVNRSWRKPAGKNATPAISRAQKSVTPGNVCQGFAETQKPPRAFFRSVTS